MRNPLAAALRLQRGGMSPTRAGYSGAVSNRLTADWIMAGGSSPDSMVRQGYRVLKQRAREMSRNNAHATRFLGLLEENVIGPNGIMLQARVGEQEGRLNKEVNWEIERAWREWSESNLASADGRLCREEIEQLAMRTVPTDGECLIRMLPGFRNSHGFALQVLDTDQLDESFDRPAGEGRNEIRMGVEVDSWGRPVAYHIWSDHPYDYRSGRKKERRVRVRADEIINLQMLRQPGQTRTVSWFAPILLDARMHAGYREAELVAARTAAAKMGFFVQDGEAVPMPMPGEGQGGPSAPGTMEAAPGMIDALPAGWSFQSWDPQHPTSAFGAFDKAILRTIAAGLRIGYNALASDLEGVNYSSLREGKLIDRDVYRLLQSSVIRQFSRPVHRTWLKWAITTGAVQLPSRDVGRYLEANFQPRGWSWVDPLKDLKASELELKMLLTSRTRICAERGIDFEDVLIELNREKQLMEMYGIQPEEVANALDGVAVDDEEEEQRGRLLRLAE